MVKEKTPQERGLTASTDTRIVQRIMENAKKSPGCFRSEYLSKNKEVDLNTLPGSVKTILMTYGSFPLTSLGTSNALVGKRYIFNPLDGKVTEIDEVATEFVIQQAWYSPYGDKEWHDFEFVDLVPKDKR